MEQLIRWQEMFRFVHAKINSITLRLISSPITAYRIEHNQTGIGPFNSVVDGVDILSTHPNQASIRYRHSSPAFPNRFEDPKIREMSYKEIRPYYFAYKSLDQLLMAFSKEDIKEFEKIGFTAYELEATDYIETEFQILFKKDSVIKLKKINL